ncbi:MAG: 2OG-Fe(II) oxygenase [Rhodovibrionaceae bacterium]
MDLKSRPAYQRGDRAPNFVLPGPGGQMGAFYDAVVARAGLLFVAGVPGNAEACLPRLAQLADRGFTVTALFHCPAEALPPQPEAAALRHFADPLGKISTAYGGPGVCVITDRNLRVLEGFNAGKEGEGLEDLEVPSLPPFTPAPALIVPHVLEPALCAELIADWEQDHQEGYVRTAEADPEKGRAIQPDVKRRQDHFLSSAKNRKIEQIVMRRIAPEVFKAFHFKTGSMQAFRVGAYLAGRGDFFRPHRDNSSPQTEHRKFAVTLNLNQDFEGGGLTFPEYGDMIYHTGTGGAVVFSCSLLHEALPVTKGSRYVLLTFLYELGGGPKRLL